MDYYSFDSEVIESLNILRPPVNRGSGIKKDYSVYCNSNKNNFQALRDFGHKFRNKRTDNFKETCPEDSSTSLFLKKTSESQILKQYSVVSYTSLHCQEQSTYPQKKQSTCKDKPLIKVTVIPKSEYNTKSNPFRKQRIITNSVETTASNHENSVQTKNVYLVVAGRNKEKIYEIKTAGSEKLRKELTKDDDNLNSFKYFIKSLNMERKRKKDIKRDSKIDRRNESLSNNSDKSREPPYIDHICKCSPATEADTNDVRPGKSRVRIFGRIGLTEDDQYILKCQATVNDHPVVTSLSTAEKQMSSTSLADYSRPETTCRQNNGFACVRGESEDTREDIRNLKDSTMQTDFRKNAVNDLLVNIDKKNRISKESQSTQVNFNKPGNVVNKPSPFRTSEQITACNCSTAEYPIIKSMNNGYDAKSLKPCQSPLVIISVFPKQDNNIADLIKTVQCAQIDNKRAMFPEDKTSNTETTKNKTTNKKPRSRSPSPRGAKAKPKSSNANTTSRNASPTRSKVGKKDSNKSTNSPKQTLQFFNSNTKKVGTEKKLKTSPARSSRAASPPAVFKKETQKKNPSRQGLKPKQKRPQQKVDKAVNTEHLKTKKALVDSYTTKITRQMNASKEIPVNSVSTISVNIDSENEQYDLSFHQNKFTTDFKVRRTMKDASAQKSFDEFEKHDSMENFFPNMSKKHGRSTICRSICKKQSDDHISNTPRLTLRDSLEIGHRREDKVIRVTQTRCRPNSTQLTINSDDMEFLAPVKHFTGDDCTICDPVERDREIRELLGVEGRKANSQYKDLDVKKKSQVFGDQISRHCFYAKQCERTLVAGFALKNSNLTKCQCIGEVKKCNDVNCDESDYKIQNDNDSSDSNDNDITEQPDQLNSDKDTNHPIKSGHQEITQTDAEQKHKGIDDQCPCGLTRKCTMEMCYKKNKKSDEKRDVTCDCKDENTHEKPVKTTEIGDKITKKSNKNSKEKEVTETEEQSVNYETKVNTSNQYQAPNQDKPTLYQQLTLNRNIQIFLQVEQFAKQKPISLSKKQYNKIKKTIQNTIVAKEKSNKREAQTDAHARKESKRHEKSKKRTKREKDAVETVVLFSTEAHRSVKGKRQDEVVVKRALSSLEIRNTSVAYWKHLTYSSTNMGSIGSSSYAKRNNNSIETIFRGRKRSLTPNLGTSALSLLSEPRISESQSLKPSPSDGKAKKPFLRRLMSCLVMKPSRDSEKKPGPVSYPPSVNSSVDSYHISSSLGAIEMTSSIYDTSVSFYSDHSIHPLNSKFKRSFFNIVRGFLTSRKS